MSHRQRRDRARTELERAVAERLLQVLRRGGDVRRKVSKRIRHKLRDDAYENDLKLSVAIDRLARELRQP